ncbi:MAG: glycosyltransferase family 4 protein [Maricaulaceae bacterium]|nr:glycosyltransferase family 4 protein [Maricaulaceae bacterium]
MTILQVIPQLSTGGAERTALEVAEAVVRAGGRALVASEGGRMEDELRAQGGEPVRMPLASKNPFVIHANAGRLERLIRAEGVTLIHARSRAPAWSALEAARRAKIPFVTTYHGAYNARSPLKRFYNSVMARGDRVIANSEYVRSHVIAEHGIDPARIITIYRGVDAALFARSPEVTRRAAALRTRWGVPGGRFIALLPARLTRWKGQVAALDAMAALRAAGRPLPFLILAGDDQGRTAYRAELEGMAAGLGLSGDVILPGHCDDMPAAFALADLVLCPSVEPEAFGRTAAEAQAAGLPVIAADHGGAREVVEDGVTGWLTAPDFPPALAAAIAHAMAMTPAQRVAMGAAGAERVKTRFTVRALQESTLRVYRDLLECGA